MHDTSPLHVLHSLHGMAIEYQLYKLHYFLTLLFNKDEVTPKEGITAIIKNGTIFARCLIAAEYSEVPKAKSINNKNEINKRSLELLFLSMNLPLYTINHKTKMDKIPFKYDNGANNQGYG